MINHEGDIENATQELRLKGIINEDEKNSIIQEIRTFLGIPGIGIYFQKSSVTKTEPEIILPDGSFYRPDRIVFDRDSTHVIDFKTGKYEKKHEDQVRGYMNILDQMSYPVAKGVLLYLYEDDKIRHVT
jgi:hypothetical protein